MCHHYATNRVETLLGSQIRVSKPLAECPVNQVVDTLDGVEPNVALVEPEREFCDVAAHVLGVPMMIDALIPALHNGPYALDSVSAGHPVDKLFDAVSNRLVLIPVSQVPVAGVFVCVDSRALCYILLDLPLESGSSGQLSGTPERCL